MDATSVGGAALVLLCEDLASAGDGLDLEALTRWLDETVVAAKVEIVPALCDAPDEVARADAEGAERVVLGLCGGEFAGLEMDRAAREAGLDPLGIEVVNLGGLCALVHGRPEATVKAGLLLAAAVARARAFDGGGAGAVAPRLAGLGQRVSRRGLFTLPPVRYRPVAVIDESRCAASWGCRRCVDVCPAGSLALSAGSVAVDRERCEACGLCVVECPRDAIALAGDAPSQLDAEITALLHTPAPGVEQRALLFVCRDNVGALEALARDGLRYSSEWLPVRVPCTGAVTPARILGALVAGADAIGVVACGGGCHAGQRERVEGAIDYCRELLTRLDRSPQGVRVLRGDPPSALAEVLRGPLDAAGGGGAEPVAERGPLPGTAAAAVLALAAPPAAAGISFEHPSSPLALVAVDAEACTLCGACARACPSDALSFAEDGDGAALRFDPARCSGCALCMGRCPEAGRHAFSVAPVTDVEALRRGRVELYADVAARCEICGAAVGPAAMVGRIEALLGDDVNAATIAAITRRCLSCRAIGGMSRAP